MRKRILLLYLSIFIIGCTSDRTREVPSSGTNTFTMMHDGVERQYRIHMPASYDGKRHVPLVVALHCYGIDGPIFMERTGWVGKSDSNGFILAFPNATGEPKEWNDGIGLNPSTREVDDVGFVSGLIDHILKAYKIDKKRVYVTGHSSGSFLSHYIASEHSDKITAIGAVAGQGTQSWLDNLNPNKPVAVVHVHTLDDPGVPFAGGMVYGVPCPPVMEVMERWAGLNGCTGEPDTTTHSNGLLGLLWKGDSSYKDVVLYRLDQGGHSWPIQPVSATDLIWTFFKDKAKP